MMASAEGRCRRSPGACISTLGPGATNLVTGIAHAYLDRSPVIALTPQLATTLDSDYTHQRIALERLFAPITKGSFVVEARSAAATVDRAIALAGTEPFGPSVAACAAQHCPRTGRFGRIGRCATVSVPAVIRPAAGGSCGALDRAGRPLVVIGLGTPASASDTVRRFVEAYGAPVGVTPKVKGIVDRRIHCTPRPMVG
jgi:acetolactate synthase-1/2/3 large subunit